MFSWKLLKPLWVGKSSENERERRLPTGAMRWAGSAFCQKSDRGPTVTWTRRRRVSGSSWKRTALRDRPASYKNKTKEALCSRLQRLKWVLNNRNFCSGWPAKCFSGIERFSWAESNCEISNYPSLWFSGIYSYSFFFLVCLHVEGDFVFSFLLLFGISSRTTHRFDRPWSWRGKINKQRRCARKCVELVLVAFFAAVPLWKRVSVCTWYKKTFLGGFFLVGSTFSGYVRQETHQPTAKKYRISRHRYTKVRFSRQNPPFYLKHVLKLRPWLMVFQTLTSFSHVFQTSTGTHTTVKEEIFVGEKFRTFPSKTFHMEFNFVLPNWPKKGKN